MELGLRLLFDSGGGGGGGGGGGEIVFRQILKTLLICIKYNKIRFFDCYVYTEYFKFIRKFPFTF